MCRTKGSMESVGSHVTGCRAGRKWKTLRWLCLVTVSYELLNSSKVSAWTYHYDKDLTILTTWDEARAWCTSLFTDMVAIQNQDEISYLVRTLPFNPNYYWIGIRKKNGDWTWVGTNKTLTPEAENWAPGEPNNKGNQQDCVEIYIQRDRDNGKWNDERCSRKKRALCYQANCNSPSCSQHGECVETIGNYTCACWPGFYGQECEEVVRCPALTPSAHATTDCSHPISPSSFRSMCNFSCEPGFTLNGSSGIECTSSGQWSSPIPTCQAVSCTSLRVPSNGWMNCSHVHGDFQYNSSCSFTCAKGFVLRGSQSVLCQASGEWTDPAATCSAVPCMAPEPPNHAQTNCSHPISLFSYRSTCDYTCDSGFTLNGSKKIECTSTGKWDSSPPSCHAVSCTSLQAPSNGRINCSHMHGDFHYNSSCSFHCAEGFVLNGSESVLCQTSEEWTDPTPTCAAVRCSSLLEPNRGNMSCVHPFGSFSYNSTCKFGCEKGFIMRETDRLHCEASGNWSTIAPTCEAVSCTSLRVPSNGWMNCSHVHGDFRYNSSCSFTCANGFELSGSQSVLCQASGEWSDPVPRCAAIKCNSLLEPERGNMSCVHPFDSYSYNSTCVFGCTKGFILNGVEQLKCEASGTWSETAPVCEAIQCPILKSPANGLLNCSHPHKVFGYQSICNYSCDRGFEKNGSEIVQCTEIGQWTGPLSSCQAKRCRPLEVSSMGIMNCSHPFEDFSFNSSCDFFCQRGFVLNGSENLYCSELANWTRDPPSCQAVQCDVLDALEQGSMSCLHPIGHFKFNSNCTFSCEEGFNLFGANNVQCMESGQWTAPRPRCEVVTCSDLSSSYPRSMNCSHPIGNFSFGSECEFQCLEGYMLNGTKRLQCEPSGSWSDIIPTCKAPDFSFSKQLLTYAGGSVLGIAGLISIGGIITFAIKYFSRKREPSLLKSSKAPVNMFENPVFENA
ncbi:P-selectin-like isoform 2-T2 [Discoglossus pictus]